MAVGYGTAQDEAFEKARIGVIKRKYRGKLLKVYLNPDPVSGVFVKKRVSGIRVVDAKRVQSGLNQWKWETKEVDGSANFQQNSEDGEEWTDLWIDCEHNRNFLASARKNKSFEIEDKDVDKDLQIRYEKMAKEAGTEESASKKKYMELSKSEEFPDGITAEDLSIKVMAARGDDAVRLSRLQQRIADKFSEWYLERVRAKAINKPEEEVVDITELNKEGLKKQIDQLRRTVKNPQLKPENKPWYEKRLQAMETLYEDKPTSQTSGSVTIE